MLRSSIGQTARLQVSRCLTFKRGAIVHFAVDQTVATMTTRLMNGKTRFLPFNRGSVMAAQVTPDIEGENATAYLYKDLPSGKAVFSRDVLLDLIGRFVHLEKHDGKRDPHLPALPTAGCCAQDT